MVNRRAVFSAIGLIGAVGVAGCTEVSDIDLSSDTGSKERGPEETVERFLSALDEGDAESANEVLHESATPVDDSSEEAETFTIVEIETEQITLREAIQQRRGLEGDELNAQVEELEPRLEDKIEEISAEEYTTVSFSVTLEEDGEQSTENDRFPLVSEDGEWLIYPELIPTQAETTDNEAPQDTDYRLNVDSVSGNVINGSEVDEISVTVSIPPNHGHVDLETVRYKFDGEEVTFNNVTDEQIRSITSETNDTVITSSSDRYELIFSASDVLGGNLQSSDTVLLHLWPEHSSATMYTLQVPNSLEGLDTVSLR